MRWGKWGQFICAGKNTSPLFAPGVKPQLMPSFPLKADRLGVVVDQSSRVLVVGLKSQEPLPAPHSSPGSSLGQAGEFAADPVKGLIFGMCLERAQGSLMPNLSMAGVE